MTNILKFGCVLPSPLKTHENCVSYVIFLILFDVMMVTTGIGWSVMENSTKVHPNDEFDMISQRQSITKRFPEISQYFQKVGKYRIFGVRTSHLSSIPKCQSIKSEPNLPVPSSKGNINLLYQAEQPDSEFMIMDSGFRGQFVFFPT